MPPPIGTAGRGGIPPGCGVIGLAIGAGCGMAGRGGAIGAARGFGIMVGAFLTFVLAIGDYITPQILGGNNELLMPQLIMMQIGRRGDFPSASALSILLMAVVTIAYIASARWLKIERA